MTFRRGASTGNLGICLSHEGFTHGKILLEGFPSKGGNVRAENHLAVGQSFGVAVALTDAAAAHTERIRDVSVVVLLHENFDGTHEQRLAVVHPA